MYSPLQSNSISVVAVQKLADKLNLLAVHLALGELLSLLQQLKHGAKYLFYAC